MPVSVQTGTGGSKQIFSPGRKTGKHSRMEEIKGEHKNKRYANVRSNQ
jgi:hypothetical protein